MATTPTAVLFTPDRTEPPSEVVDWLAAQSLRRVGVRSPDELMALALRARPRLVVFDARRSLGSCVEACRRLKQDSFTGIVPAAVVCGPDDADVTTAFEAGADEVLREAMPAGEAGVRLTVLLRRSDRDANVHASTRLPGTEGISAELARRMHAGLPFAVCYADLDHFKEFNDRYSYAEGDQVIRILAKILHDVVKGMCGEEGFVGHIGGDDFIFIVPVTAMNETCAEIIDVFDTIIPYQYSEADRRAEYFFGKDRRGQLHRVPLMTVSIGVVTNERRRFTSPTQISELATEMKSYAKTLVGSVYAVDRRQDPVFLGGEPADGSPDALIGREHR